MYESTADWPLLRRDVDEALPDSVSAYRRRTVTLLALLFSLLHLGTLATAPWDWDEALFSIAVQGDYDVSQHHPHPPGFPVYIAAARVIAPLSGAFPALQSIVVASSMAVFPLAFLVATEMGFAYRTSVVGAALLSSFPNVVVFGGSAFSDVPSLALTLVTVVLLLRGRRSGSSFAAAAVLMALAAGIRVQSVLACGLPGLLAARRHGLRFVLRAATVTILITVTIYGAAAAATGSWDAYRDAVSGHGEYIRSHDSWQSPTRAPLGEVFGIVLEPWQAGELAAVVLFFGIVALIDAGVNRHGPTLVAIGTFGPFFVFAWLMLDPYSMSRMSIGYMPLHALLAARGIEVTAGMLSGWLRVRQGAFVVVLGGALSISMLGWVRDPLSAIRADDPPPVAAMRWAKTHLAPDETTVWVEGTTLAPFAGLELSGWDVRYFTEWAEIRPDALEARQSWVIVEGRHDDAAVTFSRTERHLRQVVRHRYFDVSVIPLESTVLFGDGWYGQEGSGSGWWRWMSGDSTIVVPGSLRARKLHIVLEYPTETRGNATISVNLDDRQIPVEARPPTGTSDLLIDLPPSRAARTLALQVTPTIRPSETGRSGDDRVLGARLVMCVVDESTPDEP